MFIIWKNCNIDNPFLTSDVCLFNINIGWLDHPIPLDELPQGGAYINRRGSSVRSWRRGNTRSSSRSAMGKTSQGRKSLRIAVGLPKATRLPKFSTPFDPFWRVETFLDQPSMFLVWGTYPSTSCRVAGQNFRPHEHHRFDHRRFQQSAVWQLAKGLRN